MVTCHTQFIWKELLYWPFCSTIVPVWELIQSRIHNVHTSKAKVNGCHYSEYQYIQNIGTNYMEYQIDKIEMLMTPLLWMLKLCSGIFGGVPSFIWPILLYPMTFSFCFIFCQTFSFFLFFCQTFSFFFFSLNIFFLFLATNFFFCQYCPCPPPIIQYNTIQQTIYIVPNIWQNCHSEVH